MSENYDSVKVGDYIIIQRQKYTKLHKFTTLETTAMLAKEQVELRNILGHKYFSTFKMIPKEGKNKRLSTLEICDEIKDIRDILGTNESGVDNRNICDDGESQTLKSEDITKLREECTGSTQILEKIVVNSKTFTAKTEYSQEKYLRRKERKYFEYIQIRKPSIRLLAEIYYRQDPDKILGIRMDTLSQIISYSGINCFGNFLLYESGTNGLIPAAFLNSMGAGTEAQLVYMHPGNVPQKQAVYALGLPEEQMDRCISVNIYSILREFYRKSEAQNSPADILETSGFKRKLEGGTTSEIPDKKLKSDQANGSESESNEKYTRKTNEGDTEKAVPKWKIENERALTLMHEKFDALVIIPREHPTTILKELLRFVKPSRPVVIFNLSKEILMEIYVDLKTSMEITGLHLTSNWLRMYQILPNRTHPEVAMSGNSGYLLYGYVVGE